MACQSSKRAAALECNYACKLNLTLRLTRCAYYKLACHEKGPSRWTAEEDDIIRQHYTAGAGAAFIETLLKNRTLSAIFARADALGVTSGRYWREDEL